MLNYGKNMQNIQCDKIHKRETIEPLELWKSDILKDDILRDETFSFEILRNKSFKNITKNHIICVKHEEKYCKRGK